jgi:hypothetical protein
MDRADHPEFGPLATHRDAMIRIEDLFLGTAPEMTAVKPMVDPLAARGFEEAQLVSMRLDSTDAVGLLFDLRQSDVLPPANTAIARLSGARDVTWSRGVVPSLNRVAWSVASLNLNLASSLTLTVEFQPEASLFIQCDDMEFWAGLVLGIGDVASSFVDSDAAAILTTLPSWRSEIDVLYHVRVPES